MDEPPIATEPQTQRAWRTVKKSKCDDVDKMLILPSIVKSIVPRPSSRKHGAYADQDRPFPELVGFEPPETNINTVGSAPQE